MFHVEQRRCRENPSGTLGVFHVERAPCIPGFHTSSLRLFNFHRALRLFHVKHCGSEPSLSLSIEIQFAPQTSLRLRFFRNGFTKVENSDGVEARTLKVTCRLWMFHVEHRANVHVEQCTRARKFKIRGIISDQVNGSAGWIFL